MKPLKYPVVFLVLISVTILFTHLSSWIPDIMESRNFISVREMLDSHEYMIPTMNEKIRIRKPPVPVWLTALSTSIANDHNDLTALRIPAGLSAIMLVIFLYLLIRDLHNREIALYCSGVLLTMYMFTVQGRTGSWDIYCHSFMLGALYFLLKAIRSDKFSLHYIWTALFLSLSFNSKGPVSFYALLLPFIIAWLVVYRKDTPRISRSGISLMLLITLLLSAAWFMYIYYKIPDITTLIVDEETGAWVDRHNQPPWFYLHFPLFTGIWLVLTIGSVYVPFKFSKPLGKSNHRFLFWWFVASFILLSIIPEKKERYFLPALIPLACLIGNAIYSQVHSIETEQWKSFFQRLFTIQTGLNIIALLAMPVLYYIYSVKADGQWLPFIILTICVTLLALSIIMSYRKRAIRSFYFLTMFIAVVFSYYVLPLVPVMLQKNKDFVSMTVLREDPRAKGIPFYTDDKDFFPVQLWEAGRPVIYIGDKYPDSTRFLFITKEPPALKPGDNRHIEILDTIRYHPKNNDRRYFISIVE